MINNVVLIGRLTKDLDIRYTASGIATASFTLAVNRQFKNQAGEREADFVRCVIWRQSAENLASWAKKGTLIALCGRIQTGSYENNQGQRVYTTDVVVDSFQILESKAQKENTEGTASAGNTGNMANTANGSQSQAQANTQAKNDYPFGEKPVNSGNNPFGTSPIEITDDDLPF